MSRSERGYGLVWGVAIGVGLALGAASAAEYPGLHCWPDYVGPSWRSCWWADAPPVEIDLSDQGALALPPPATWSGGGRCQNIVSYAMDAANRRARRRIVVHCDGSPVSDKALELLP